MPLDYSAVEEYHVRLEKNGQFQQGRMWLGEGKEWEIEVSEGTPRLSAPHTPHTPMDPLHLFERVVTTLAPLDLRLRACGTCAHFRRSPHESGEGWLGYCSYRGTDADAPLLPGPVSLLAPDCHAYQPATETPPLADPYHLASQGELSDLHVTKALPAAPKKPKSLFGSLRDLLGLKKEEQEMIRAGVVERPGGQPCPVCGTRMTNRASVANADKRGEERVLSVWRCPHCSGNYLDDWFEAFVGSKSYDAERLYVVPPLEANAGAAIVVHCPRPDVKGCTCIANQHFDRWGDDLEQHGRRIKHRESVVSL